MPVSIDRMPNKPHIQRGANGTAATVRPVQGVGPQGPPGPGNSNADVAGYVTGAGPTQTALNASTAAQIATDVPAATTTTPGRVELATTAETTTGTDTVRAVTPAGVKAAIDALLNGAPGALDTLKELADAIGDDANYAASTTTALNARLVKSSNLSDLPSPATARTNLGVQYATTAETILGIAVDRVLSPADLNAAIVYAPAPSGDATGVTDRVAIQALIDGLTAFGGGTVTLRSGTYWVNHVTHPTASNVQSALFIRPGVTLAGWGSQSIVKLTANQVQLAGTSGTAKYSIITNYNVASKTGGDADMGAQNLLVDGNAANQTINMGGIRFGYARNVMVHNVVVQNIYGGTDGTAATETFCFEFYGGVSARFTDCIARSTSLAYQTSSGFSADTSSDLSWVGCTAYDIGGMGFTHWTCSNVRYAACHAYRVGVLTGGAVNAPAARGFNSEISDSVTYTGCIAGGRAAHTTDNAIFTDQQNLGNKHGFYCSGSTNVDYVGCQGNYNVGDGIAIVTNGGSVVPDSVRIIGGSFCNNGAYGIDQQSGTNVVVSYLTRTTGNTAGNTAGVTAPAVTFGAVTASGLSVSVGAASAIASINANAGQSRDLAWYSAGSSRWIARATSDAEAGSDAGTKWQLISRTDAGAFKATVIDVDRRTGVVQMASGAGTKTKNGVPSDADWAVAPPDGTIVVDASNSRIYTRVGGVWKYAALT